MGIIVTVVLATVVVALIFLVLKITISPKRVEAIPKLLKQGKI